MQNLKHIVLTTAAFAATGIIGLQPISALPEAAQSNFTYKCITACKVSPNFAFSKNSAIEGIFTLDNGSTFALVNGTSSVGSFQNTFAKVTNTGSLKPILGASPSYDHELHRGMFYTTQYKNKIIIPYIDFQDESNSSKLQLKIFTPNSSTPTEYTLANLPSGSALSYHEYNKADGFIYSVVQSNEMSNAVFYIIKYIPEGETTIQRIESNELSRPRKIDVDKDGNVYVVGENQMYMLRAADNYSYVSALIFALDPSYIVYSFVITNNGKYALLATNESTYLQINLSIGERKLFDMSKHGVFSSTGMTNDQNRFYKAAGYITFAMHSVKNINGQDVLVKKIYRVNANGTRSLMARTNEVITDPAQNPEWLTFSMDQFGDVYTRGYTKINPDNTSTSPVTKIDFTY